MDWLVQSEQDISAAPNLFLSRKEQVKFDSLRFLKRRNDWLVGRWTAKQLLATVLERERNRPIPAQAIEIFNGVDGAPRVYINDEPLALNLSISHSHGYALCAVDTSSVGADLEWIEPREECLVNDFFTASEQAHVWASAAIERDRLVTAIWSAKEAGSKALHKGLTIDTRTLEIGISTRARGLEEWEPFELTVRLEHQTHLHGWWRETEGLVLTLALSGKQQPRNFPISPLRLVA